MRGKKCESEKHKSLFHFASLFLVSWKKFESTLDRKKCEDKSYFSSNLHQFFSLSSMDQSPNAKQIRSCSVLLLLTEQDDMVLFIFEALDFPTLLRIQQVCTHWKQKVDQFLPRIVGRKKFMTREELRDKIKQCCCVDKFKFADELARTYGWPVGKWNVSMITNFESAFWNQFNFNEDMSEWDVSNATSFRCMFYRARSFHQDLAKWNTSKVTTMFGMFCSAQSFNGNISKWDTSRVTTMRSMFRCAYSFNSDISKWNTPQVTDMEHMFRHARSFCQMLITYKTMPTCFIVQHLSRRYMRLASTTK